MRAVPYCLAYRELVYEIGMEFIGIEEGLYLFKLDGEHRGHDWYKGISGGRLHIPWD